MDRSTTREEYKAFMRKWRAVMANAGPVDGAWRRDRGVQEPAFSIVFDAVYKLVPQNYWDLRPLGFHGIYKSPGFGRIGMRLNVRLAPNSYPHKTRNP